MRLTSKYHTEHQLGVVAMMRTGHHAVMAWLESLFNGPCWRQDALGDNFYVPPILTNIPAGCPTCRLRTFQCQSFNVEEHSPLVARAIITKLARFSTDRPWRVLVLRDPYNMFASRLRAMRSPLPSGRPWPRPKPHRNATWCGEDAVQMWIEHALEYLRESRTFPSAYFLPIAYDRWCDDEAYRRTIATALGRPYREDRLERVPHYGYGSSFEQERLDGRARQMPTRERWRAFVHDPEYRQIFESRLLKQLAKEIFGEPPFDE